MLRVYDLSRCQEGVDLVHYPAEQATIEGLGYSIAGLWDRRLKLEHYKSFFAYNMILYTEYKGCLLKVTGKEKNWISL